MIAPDLLTVWAALDPLERATIRDMYLHDRRLSESARRQGTGLAEASQALQSAYRRIAAFVLAPPADDASTARTGGVAPVLRTLAELPTATWRWNTAQDQMAWSDGMFELYGYPVGAVSPTIGRHQSHKQLDDRSAVERLVLASATQTGPVVFPQRIIRTDGSECRVVMHVVREPGREEVLTGRVVADARV